MDDLISRRAALDALDAICDRECEYSKKQRAVMCASCHLGSAFDAIDELEAQELKWIPCSERLPEENGRYLVTLHTYGALDFKVDETVVKIIPFFDKWRTPTHSPEWINEALTQEVLAWMPLPGPYKEQNDGREGD